MGKGSCTETSSPLMSSLPVKEWSNWETWDWVAFSVLKPQQLIHWWEPLTTCPRSEYMNMATTLNPTFGHWAVFYTKWLPYRVHLYVNVSWYCSQVDVIGFPTLAV